MTIPYLCCVSPLKSSRDLSTLVSNQSLLLQEQAGFWNGRSNVDQVTLLTQDIEDSFSAKKKAGAVFVDLTAAYDALCHRGLTCKLLRLLPDRHMVCMTTEMVGNRSFTLTASNGKRNRLQCLKNGVLQGSVLVPLILNIYISDLPTTVSRKYAYDDDLAITHADGDWQARGADQGHRNVNTFRLGS